MKIGRVQRARVVLGLVFFYSQGLAAANLPESRADAMYHFYTGDKVEVSGPALLVGKDILDSLAINGSYYVDNISSASVDVRTYGSPYKDTRTQYGFGLDYLYKDSLMSLAGSKSGEKDYQAKTLDTGVAVEFFGGMSTVNLGYSRGFDTVGKRDTQLAADLDRNSYRLGWTQILTSSLISNISYEAVTEEGYLNNPYRLVKFGGQFTIEEENHYPRTRSSQAVAIRGILNFTETYSSSIRLDYRYFWDTWEISAHTVSATYNFYLSRQMLLDAHYKWYSQSKASFYNDNFAKTFNYMARDKELSTFSNNALGVKVGYQLNENPMGIFNRLSFNVAFDFIRFDYNDFTGSTGKPFSFDASVFQFFLSAWF